MYLFGFGIGCILVGLGYWKAKYISHKFQDNGILSWPTFIHDHITKSLIGIGALLSIYFLIRILIQII